MQLRRCCFAHRIGPAWPPMLGSAWHSSRPEQPRCRDTTPCAASRARLLPQDRSLQQAYSIAARSSRGHITTKVVFRRLDPAGLTGTSHRPRTPKVVADCLSGFAGKYQDCKKQESLRQPFAAPSVPVGPRDSLHQGTRGKTNLRITHADHGSLHRHEADT
jgi:hypothetical protein